jgi:hypothetical protein
MMLSRSVLDLGFAVDATPSTKANRLQGGRSDPHHMELSLASQLDPRITELRATKPETRKNLPNPIPAHRVKTDFRVPLTFTVTSMA